MKLFGIAIIFLFNSAIMEAQNELSVGTNLMRDSDSVSMQEVTFTWCGDSGMNCIWDFSSVEDEYGAYPIEFRTDTLGNYKVFEDGHISTYCFNSNTIQQTKLENRFQILTYHEPMFVIRYPFRYGDSFTQSYSGVGMYCGEHQLKFSGQSSVSADGYGKLILSENDTIDNVLRVYRLTTMSIAMDMDSIALDTALLKQEVVEQYEWYVKGYRYPLYKTIQRTSYSDLDYIASQSSAYRILPADYNLKKNDDKNDSVLASGYNQSGQNSYIQKDVFHYDVQVIGSKIIINYNADEDIAVKTLLSDVMGYVYRRNSVKCRSEKADSIEIDCTGMRRGNYVLYINVNGKIYSDKVIL